MPAPPPGAWSRSVKRRLDRPGEGKPPPLRMVRIVFARCLRGEARCFRSVRNISVPYCGAAMFPTLPSLLFCPFARKTCRRQEVKIAGVGLQARITCVPATGLDSFAMTCLLSIGSGALLGASPLLNCSLTYYKDQEACGRPYA